MHEFPKFYLVKNSICFGHFLCPSSGVFYCTFDIGAFLAGLMTASKQGQVGSILKHVELFDKIKFWKFVHLVGFIKMKYPYNSRKRLEKIVCRSHRGVIPNTTQKR